ncbi:hypothetical protein Tco_1175260 [Tanacetum coccineum]
MEDENPIRTLEDYSKPSHEGYRNTIKLPVRNNVTTKLRNDIQMFQQHFMEIFYEDRTHSRRITDQSAGGKLHDRNAKESWALLEDLALYDNESGNDPRDFAKPVKAIALPQDVPSTFDRRLIEIKNQMMYNCIMRRKLNPRENANGGVSNFTGRIKGMHVFVGDFTYIMEFMIIEDISSILDPRLSQVLLGKPFVEISNMTHDPPEGVVRFTNGNNEVSYKMPHKIE